VRECTGHAKTVLGWTMLPFMEVELVPLI